jgi:hypothetical protein
MSAETADTDDKFTPDVFYETSVALTGYAPEIGLFDSQLAGVLEREWLFDRAQIEEDVDREEAETILAEGLVRQWEDREGNRGFIPYSPRQVGIFRTLKQTGRYGLAELQHIAECWGDYLEAVVMDEPPYDDRSVSDFENFSRRVEENVAFFQDEVERSTRDDENANERLEQWSRTATVLKGKSDETIGDRLRSAIARELWQQRWNDEFVRLIMAQKFEAQITSGCSVEVTFNGSSWNQGTTQLSDINWKSTFLRLRDVRKEGKQFPLRLPEFTVTETGIQHLARITPEQYSDLYARYRLEDMYRVLGEMGKEVWSPAPAPLGDAVCPECREHFDRKNPTRVYCGEPCRSRARHKRWREKDPERARQAQARYWKSYDLR